MLKNQTVCILTTIDIDYVGRYLTFKKSFLQGDIRVQKEAAWAINNLFSGGSVHQKNCLLDCGILEPYCGLLLSLDSRMVEIVLEGLGQLLEVRNHD